MILTITNIHTTDLEILGLPYGGKIPRGATRAFDVNSFQVGGGDGSSVSFPDTITRFSTMGWLTYSLATESGDIPPPALTEEKVLLSTVDGAASVGIDGAAWTTIIPPTPDLQGFGDQVDALMGTHQSQLDTEVLLSDAAAPALTHQVASMPLHVVWPVVATETFSIGSDAYEFVDMTAAPPVVTAAVNIGVPMRSALADQVLAIEAAINGTAVDEGIEDGAANPAAFVGTENVRADMAYLPVDFLNVVEANTPGGSTNLHPVGFIMVSTLAAGGWPAGMNNTLQNKPRPPFVGVVAPTGDYDEVDTAAVGRIFVPGDLVVDTALGNLHFCISNATGAASWKTLVNV